MGTESPRRGAAPDAHVPEAAGVPRAATRRPLGVALWPLVSDLASHRPRRYWVDLLASLALFWGAWCAINLRGASVDPANAALFVVAGTSLYRAATFMHEIVHMPRAAVPGFRLAWNALCGIPLMLPVSLYASHIDHHVDERYATLQDPEYLPFATRPLRSWALLMGGAAISQAALWVRFAVLLPVSLLVPPLRRWIASHASAVAIHPDYLSDRFGAAPWTAARTAESVACVLVAWGWAGVALGGPGVAHWAWSFAAIVVCVLLVNALRTRYSHRWAFGSGPVTHRQQVEDSVTLGGSIWTELFAPVGLRFHGLHHLFPALPYHALPEAHRRLVRHPGEAADSYRLTCLRPGEPRAESV